MSHPNEWDKSLSGWFDRRGWFYRGTIDGVVWYKQWGWPHCPEWGHHRAEGCVVEGDIAATIANLEKVVKPWASLATLSHQSDGTAADTVAYVCQATAE